MGLPGKMDSSLDHGFLEAGLSVYGFTSLSPVPGKSQRLSQKLN